MLTLIAFALALGLLIAVHEYGHYRMARLCGVKVLRFSIGFGRALARWQPKGSSTEFVLGAFPLGGYVLMLDEREAPVPESERHLAFNTRPLRSLDLDRRIDYVFVTTRKKDGRGTVHDCRVALTERDGEGADAVCASDHYAVCADVQIATG